MSEKQIRKHKERASRLLAKGKIEDALIEFHRCVKLDPRDLSVRQKLAETFARLGKIDEAVREYQSVAGSYAADGLLLKAIAINKVILSLDPRHTETQHALANLYAHKRGDLAPSGGVQLPKAMSAALGGKKSAADIRGTPAAAIGPSTPGEAPPTPPRAGRAPPALPSDAGEPGVIDLDEEPLEVVSVEEQAPALGAQISTNLSQLLASVGTGAAAVDEGGPSVDLDIDIASFDDGSPIDEDEGDEDAGGDLDAVVLGTPVDTALPADESIDLIDDDGGELIDVAEPAEINTAELPPIPLFSDLPQDAFIALTERMNLHQAEAGEILIAEGEYATSMYIVIQGKVKVVRELSGGDELKLAELADGTFFGEMALLSDAPRTASVIAVEETMLFEISRDLVGEITAQYPQVEQVMKRFHRNRLLTNLLRTSPIFAPFSAQDKKSLIEKFKSRSVEADKILITREKSGDGLYVLLSGRCEVVAADAQGRDVVIAELKEGDVFGEMSMLWKKATTASVRTVTPCIVLRLPRKDFDVLIMTHPQVLEALSSLSAERAQFNKELLDSDDDVLADFLV